MRKLPKHIKRFTHLDDESIVWAKGVMRELEIPWTDDWENFFRTRVKVVPDELMEPVEFPASPVASIWKYDLAEDTAVLNAKLLIRKDCMFHRTLLEIAAHRYAHLNYFAIARDYVIEDTDDEMELAHRRQEIHDELRRKLSKGSDRRTISDFLRLDHWSYMWAEPVTTFMQKSHRLARKGKTKENP